jgi:hypothetical protein
MRAAITSLLRWWRPQPSPAERLRADMEARLAARAAMRQRRADAAKLGHRTQRTRRLPDPLLGTVK